MDRPLLKTWLPALAATLLGLFAAAPAGAALSAETMLEPSTVVAIDLQLPPDSIEALEAEPDEYVEGTFALAETDGTPAGIGEYTAPLTVGIRLKGSASFEGLDGKAAFKIKFNEFVKGQKFFGLKKLTLNNMVQDPSMVHEALTYSAFRAAGLSAPHTGYAYVHLNGVDYGIHLNIETIDDVALEKRFGPFDDPQHLYEGTPRFDLRPDEIDNFEVDEGDEDERGDLEALAAAASAASPSFSERIAPVADLAQMTKFWAAERYLGHWDGYSSVNLNNYYLYSDPTGVFQMLPWGSDQTLHNWWHPFTGQGGMLFEQCLEEEACRATYREDLSAVEESTTALDLAARAQALAALLAPWQAKELAESERAPHDAEAIATGVGYVLEFLERRPVLLANWLQTGEEPSPEEPGGDEDPVVVPPAKETPPPPVPPTTISPRLELDRSKLGRGLLVARPTVSGEGAVSLRASIGPAGARRSACVAAPKPVTAGSVYLECRLLGEVRRRLAKRSLTLQLTVGHLPSDGGPPLTLTRAVRIPRQTFG